MMDLEGIIDFDLVRTIVQIEDDYVCVDRGEQPGSIELVKQPDFQRSKSAMPGRVSGSKSNISGPTKFRIEVCCQD